MVRTNSGTKQKWLHRTQHMYQGSPLLPIFNCHAAFSLLPKAIFTPSIQLNLGLPLQYPSSHTVHIHSLQLSLLRQLPFYCCSSTHHFIASSIHSGHSHQISQTLHLRNIQFYFFLSTSYAHACAPYIAVGTITPSYKHFFAFIFNPLLLWLPMLYNNNNIP